MAQESLTRVSEYVRAWLCFRCVIVVNEERTVFFESSRSVH